MNYYELDSEEVVSYAFSYFNAPSDQEAELWVGSDEALKIYINGQQVYSYSGTRSFRDDELLSEKVTANIKQGDDHYHKIIVENLYEKEETFSISIDDPDGDGTGWPPPGWTVSSVDPSTLTIPAGGSNIAEFSVKNDGAGGPIDITVKIKAIN